MKSVLSSLLLLAAAPAAAELRLTSPTLAEGATLPAAQMLDGFGCNGANLSPPLAWSGLPEGTQALAVTLYDPDAPTGSGFWHWGVFNLPADLPGLAEGMAAALPAGALHARNDFGQAGYGGACPPAGAPAHRYVLTLYALPAPLPPDAAASGAMLGFFLGATATARASLTLTLGR